ncbi:ABC transporter permease subunit [Salinibacillus xinjiangensis]|uniref:ABC transporter permease subunit n=1 Tax=Salinibacillus xinjiangensis TaxID=1229268 RepID=A0A6G1X5R7_9BACI|nr:ABC transporter permease subunit [Salinibacillus xinjiangensis]MRG86246.1 ABC transporter permease subunit [Salinibacillus xinjiangensis]
MKFIKPFIYYILGIVGILCISIMPQVFQTRGLTDIKGYFIDLSQFFKQFVNPDSWVYIAGRPPKEFPLLDVLWDPFIYSMQILLGALLLGFLIAFIFAFVANFLPKVLLNPIKRLLDLLESVPDLIVAILLQMLVIYIYKATGVKIFSIATYMDSKIYLAPIITLAILPMVSLFKVLLLMVEEEFLKDYVVFAESKGIKRKAIILRHILKNITPSAFYHSKVILWGTLSSQFIIERIFSIEGLTFYMVEGFDPITIAVSLIMLFTPFFVFYQFIDVWLEEERVYGKVIGQKRSRWRRVQAIQPLVSLRNFIEGFGRSIKQIRKPRLLMVYPLKVFFVHMKNIKFAIGSLFFIGLIVYSALYSITTDNHVDQERIVYEEDGATIKSAPPHAPPEPFLLGSDKLGFSLYDQIVIGAKYTLIFALAIALLRVLIGFLMGTFYAFHLNTRGQKWLEKLVDSTHFLPLSIIAYLLLAPILMETRVGFAYSFSERIIIEIVILTILVVPLTTVLIGNEMKQTLNKEFITSAKVLGGSKFHVLWKHIIPHIGPRLTIVFGQQFIQVLLIFIHLGVFNFFFGGTNVSFENPPDPPRSITYEWSGLIGSTTYAMSGNRYWIILWVLIAFMLSIIAMQFIIQGVKEVQQVKVGVVYSKRKLRKSVMKQKRQQLKKETLTDEDFVWVHRRDGEVPLE